jgi:acyl carrier protein
MESIVGSKVRSFVVTNYLFGDEDRMPADDDSLIEGGVIDSTGILELIEFLEESFDISVAESETIPQNLGTISGIEAYIARKIDTAELAPSE